ncbi:hypothetical protein MNEG_11152 [Monoraphidium neglectum]|uniref:Uncharacterized protein n=1 Tax=Monoraphidium neglectum TaxID=145388 RepID=A0A0D2KM43_9CHLO|nr:hypothetical protein MNEG_11152 [Monoraphidium neglectum]KIY96808.1 hypothetical protein MNEG_11152 [Monoraphidium neglectum]|eukprot:XP_013895828.1 hypothetical protein MNEG_11152 [Monoraphidium neglectum]
MLLIAAAFAAPALLQPLGGVRWWHLLVAAAAAPFAALANTRAAGATDISAAPAFFAAALVAFAAWGGAGGGVGVGLVAAGLLLGVAQSAAEMGFSFAAGYTTLASPTAVFVAHVVGCVAGALFAPFAYALLSPALPPSPLAAPARAVAALFAQGGARALPAYAGWMGLAALVVGLVLASVRQVISSRARVMVPMPVVMGVIFLAGANVAVGVAFGAALRIAWRWRHPRSADAYAALVGGALIAGDGVWGVGRALLASFGVAAPICMSFAPAPSAVP